MSKENPSAIPLMQLVVMEDVRRGQLKLSEINPKYQAFLWQPTNKALGIERLYKIDKK